MHRSIWIHEKNKPVVLFVLLAWRSYRAHFDLGSFSAKVLRYSQQKALCKCLKWWEGRHINPGDPSHRSNKNMCCVFVLSICLSMLCPLIRCWSWNWRKSESSRTFSSASWTSWSKKGPSMCFSSASQLVSMSWTFHKSTRPTVAAFTYKQLQPIWNPCFEWLC